VSNFKGDNIGPGVYLDHESGVLYIDASEVCANLGIPEDLTDAEWQVIGNAILENLTCGLPHAGCTVEVIHDDLLEVMYGRSVN